MKKTKRWLSLLLWLLICGTLIMTIPSMINAEELTDGSVIEAEEVSYESSTAAIEDWTMATTIGEGSATETINNEKDEIDINDGDIGTPAESFDEMFSEAIEEDEVSVLERVEAVDSGKCGDNLSWTLDNDRVLTISGTGKMYDWDNSNNRSPFSRIYYIEKVVISEGATSIGNAAFYGCQELTSIIIPNGVSSIGSRAFGHCTSMTNITLPNSMTAIGKEAFGYCTSLTSIVLPNSVKFLRDGIFLNCSSLASISIPSSVTSIESNTFSGCSSLNSITIPNNVNSIGDSAFKNCSSITSITLPNSLTAIGNQAFYGCSSLTSIIIPKNVNSIGGSAFNGCSSLTSIDIPESVRDLGSGVFIGCTSLTAVTLPTSLKIIPGSSFRGCSALTNIQIPERVTKIGDLAFANCSSLRNIIIPSRVTNIESRAFDNCTSLTSISFPQGVVDIGSFMGCTQLTSITIPDTVTSLRYEAFAECSSLSEVHLPNTLTRLRYSSFRNCTSLKSITLPNSLTTMDDSAFEGCSNLNSITIPSGVSKLNKYVFKDCGKLQSITFAEESILNNGSYQQKGLRTICESPFEGCTSLTSITLPSTVKEIQEDAFYNCTFLKEITFMGNAPSKWGYYVFSNVSATAYYLNYTKGWTESVLQNYGGNITWSMKTTGIKSAEITGLYNSSKGGDLRWKAVPGAERYNIYRTNGGKTERIAILSNNTTSFMDESISTGCWGKVYVYYVCSVVGVIETPRENGQTLQRLAPMKIYYNKNDKNGSATLKWDVTSGSNKAFGYELQYALSKTDLFGQKGSFKKVALDGRNKLSTTINGLSKGQTYYFRVRAYVNYTHSVTKRTTKTWSQYSDVVSVKITK